MADAETVESLAVSMDNMWLMTSAYRVLMMQAGFALLESSVVREKNLHNILLKNLLDMVISAFTFWAVGWAFAFGTGSSFIGVTDFFLWDTVAAFGHAAWLFQFSFCAAASTIISGAVAERMPIMAYMFISVVVTTVVYPIVVHWVWSSDGWLFNAPVDTGYIDFAGSSVVHLVGGVSSLVATVMLGPRINRFRRDGTVRYFGPVVKNVNSVLATFFLWIGWLSFNSGSTLAVTGTGHQTSAIAAFNSVMGSAAGALSSAAIGYFKNEKMMDPESVINGILGGLVSITATAHIYDTWQTIVVSGIGGVVVQLASDALIRLRIDDPVSAFPVHGACGAWAIIAAGLVAPKRGIDLAYGIDSKDYGVLLGGGFSLLGWQLIGLAAIVVWSTAISFVCFLIINKTFGLRVAKRREKEGLDASFKLVTKDVTQEEYNRFRTLLAAAKFTGDLSLATIPTGPPPGYNRNGSNTSDDDSSATKDSGNKYVPGSVPSDEESSIGGGTSRGSARNHRRKSSKVISMPSVKEKEQESDQGSPSPEPTADGAPPGAVE